MGRNRNQRLKRGLLVMIVLSVTLGAHPAPAAPSTFTLVSHGVNGEPLNNRVESSAVSPNGRRVAFASRATNVLPGIDAGRSNIYVWERLTQQISWITSSFSGGDPDGDSRRPSFSGDGRYLAFESSASNLVSGDTNGVADVFVKDLSLGTVARVSVTGAGVQGNGVSSRPYMCGNGSCLVFDSAASNLVSGDTNSSSDVFLKDLGNGSVKRVSLTDADAEAARSSGSGSVSNDGRYVLFHSWSELVTGIDPPTFEVRLYLRDTVWNTTRAAAVNAAGSAVADPGSRKQLSADGRYVVFSSADGTIVPGDSNLSDDAFRRDLLVNETVRISLTPTNQEFPITDGVESHAVDISSDGRRAAFKVRDHLSAASRGIYLRNIPSGVTTLIDVDGYSEDLDNGQKLSSDGRFVLFLRNNYLAYLYDGGETDAPTIANVNSDPAAFNNVVIPPGESEPASTVISSHLEDSTPPIVWQIQITGPDILPSGATPPTAPVRTFSGTLNDYQGDISATWDGKDANGLPVPDGQYTVTVTATDDWGNVGTGTGSVRVDVTPPILSLWRPKEGSNNQHPRPQLRVIATDALSGIDFSTRTMTVDGFPVSTAVSGSEISGAPGFDLAIDQSHELRVTVEDGAANEVNQVVSFWSMRLDAGLLDAEIKDNTFKATVPSLSQCQANCTVIFSDVHLTISPHEIALSSTAHEGSGTVTRAVDLSSAKVRWNIPLDPERPAGLVGVTFDDPLEVDDAFAGSVSLPVLEQEVDLGQVTVSVPPGVGPESEAVLFMTSETVPPPCGQPESCAGLPGLDHDPLPDPTLPSPLDGDPSVDPPVDFSSEETAPTLPGLASNLPELDQLPSLRPPKGTPITNFAVGKLAVKVAAQYTIQEVVNAHGGASQIKPAVAGPYTTTDLKVGLNRNFVVYITPGTELTKLESYAQDPKVEYVHLVTALPPTQRSVNDDYADEHNQWNLFGPTGIHAQAAWDWNPFNWPNEGAGPRSGHYVNDIEMAILDTGIRGTHVDFSSPSGNKVKAGISLFPSDPWPGAGADSEGGCSQSHGSHIAGMNTHTNNDKGLAGVNFGGSLVPVIVEDENCNWAPMESHGEWIHRAATTNAEIMNISHSWTSYDQAGCDAIESYWLSGGIVVTSSPEGDSLSPWPEDCPYTLSSTATSKAGKVSSWAHPSKGTEVGAPGQNLSSIHYQRTDSYELTDGGAFNSPSDINGTSFAAPQVAGLAQLLLAMGVPNTVAFDQIWYPTTPVPGCEWHPCYGKVNAARSVYSAMKNGAMEHWSGTPSLPWPWKKWGNCPNATITKVSGLDNTTFGGTSGAKVRCAGMANASNTFTELYQWVGVSPGWTYRFTAQVKRDSSGPNPTNVQAIVCFYRRDPGGVYRAQVCYSQPGIDQTNERVGSAWDRWSFLAPAPAGAQIAYVRLRSYSDSSGYVYWDDVGFHACKAPGGAC